MKPHHRVAAILILAFFGYGVPFILAVDRYEHSGKQYVQASKQTLEVVLWKIAKEVEVASLTPGCDELDWGCVTGEAHNRGWRAKQ
jgi:hypothetical protein